METTFHANVSKIFQISMFNKMHFEVQKDSFVMVIIPQTHHPLNDKSAQL